MKFIPQKIPEVILIEPEIHGDNRGYFLETFRQDLFEQAVGHQVCFKQDNESKSSKGVLRGLHFQAPPFSQSKLVRVIYGSVLDVAVDIRVDSPNYGQYVAIELTDLNQYQLFIPRGFAHGFVVLSETAVFAYKVDNYYAPDFDMGLAYNDESIAINWQIKDDLLQLSEKDKMQPTLEKLISPFNYQTDYYSE